MATKGDVRRHSVRWHPYLHWCPNNRRRASNTLIANLSGSFSAAAWKITNWGSVDRLFFGGGGAADVIIGSSQNDNLMGGLGADQLFGGVGDDAFTMNAGELASGEILDGGAGNDTLVGGGNDDVFVFARGDGADTIVDFLAGAPEDRIWFAGTSLHLFADALANAANVGGNSVITYNGFFTVTLNGVTTGQLTAGDFIFT